MSRNVSTGSVRERPPAFSTKSFTRFEPTSKPVSPTHRHRASTLTVPTPSSKSPDEERKDVFNKVEQEADQTTPPPLSRSTTLPERFDELPIELASLTDRFVESLSTKSFEQPPSIEQISELFQDFYITAASRISTHISTLITRLNREPSPTSNKTLTKPRPLVTNRSSESLNKERSDSAQQMLTASEVTERRKARKLLEHKRVLLEEAVERRACEKVYDKIWRHKSTLDEVRDEKLRSKTAALALVGIGLKDLGIEIGAESDKTSEDIQELLAPARDQLMQMNDVLHPLGKLQRLTAAHKTIVDTLSSIHGSSSSADEILPTLIYTLVTSPVEGINIISNLYFIQRFRSMSKVDGESAYCMTNLEAAISFLENVDLSSLRAEERPEGPAKTPSQPQTPTIDKADPFPEVPTAVSMATTTAETSTAAATATLTAESKQIKKTGANRHQRTLSDLFQPVTAANEAVQNKAKEGIETISNTLDNSLNFLFGRLREQAKDPSSPKDMMVPKTLDEARQLVNRPVGPEVAEDVVAASDASSIADKDLSESPMQDRSKSEDKILSLFGGKKTSSVRERSVDSQRSNGSSRKVTFTPGSDGQKPLSGVTPSPTSSTTPLDSFKNLGSSLNSLSQIGNAFGSGFRGFGRPSASTNLAQSRSTENLSIKDKKAEPVKGVEDERVGSDRDIAASASTSTTVQISLTDPTKTAKKIRDVKGPIPKFIETENAIELKVGDIQDLLDDYKRLAGVLVGLANSTTIS